MNIIYECEKLVILQEEDAFLIHVLDNYRFVKEIKTNRKNLFFELKKEFPNVKFKIENVCGSKLKCYLNKWNRTETLLSFIWNE